MSTIWTPSGEQPVGREEPGAATPRQPQQGPQSQAEGEAELQALQEDLARTPAAGVIVDLGADRDRARAVGDLGAVEEVLDAVVARDRADPRVVVEVSNRAGRHERNLRAPDGRLVRQSEPGDS